MMKAPHMIVSNGNFIIILSMVDHFTLGSHEHGHAS